MDATLQDLREKHPEYQAWSGVWPDYRLAYRGGHEFLLRAGDSTTYRYAVDANNAIRVTSSPAFRTPPRRFLKQLEGEPDEVYRSVWERAEYINYLGGILNYFCTWLFATPPIIQAEEGAEKPDWYAEVDRDATGGHLPLNDFIKAQFLEALLCRRSGWMLGRQESVAEQGEDDRVALTPFAAEEIWDWQKSANGTLEWVVLGKCRLEREFPNKRKRVETITFLNREEWSTWEVVRGEGGKDEATKLGGERHGLGKVPFVMLEIPEGIWVTDKLYAWAIGLFNQWTRIRSAMLLACIMQPYIQTSETRETAQSRVFGEGILLHLRAPDGVGGGGEDFGWKTPNTEPVKFSWDHFKEAVAEGYRIVHQMSMAVDAKSVASIARSGTSKVEDRKATEVVLKGFGAVARAAELETLTLLSECYGDGTVWTVDGYDDFSMTEPLELLQMLALGSTLGIQSATFEKRRQRKAAHIILDGEDESTMGDVENEIDEAEDLAAEMAAPLTKAPPEQEQESDEEAPPRNGAPSFQKKPTTEAPPNGS